MRRPYPRRPGRSVVGGLAAAALPTAVVVLLPGAPALAQQAGYGQTLGTSPLERQLYDYGPGKSGFGGSGSILDSTNPLDLLNKLKRSTALDDATPPDSAVDQALRDFDARTAPPASSAPSVSPKGI